MEYGYVITCQDAGGELFTVSDGWFGSYDEARDAMDDQWQAMEDDGDSCEPVDYEIYEN